METKTTTWAEFPNAGKAILEQILASKERKKPKKPELGESHSGILIGKFTSSIRSEFTQSITSIRIGYPVLMMEIKVSKGNSTLADGLIKRTSYMLDEIASTMHEDEEGDW